ncbi:MAG: amidohydrolase family protein, partial [Bacteroidota bacterium]
LPSLNIDHQGIAAVHQSFFHLVNLMPMFGHHLINLTQRMKNAPITIFILFLVGSFSLIKAQTIFIEDATLIDPVQQKEWKGNLLIQGDTIAGFPSSLPDDFDGISIDASGNFLLPALVDMHTHSWGNSGPSQQMEYLGTDKSARYMLYCGVGAFLDLFSPEDYILGLRDQQRTEGLPGADIHCAGPILTCDGGHGTEYGVPTRTVNTSEEAREQVAELAKKRPDVIKLVYDHVPGRMPSMDRATMQAIVSSAHKAGIKVVVHIGNWQDIYEVAQADADCITHTPTGTPPDSVIAIMKQKEMYTIPTLAVQSEMAFLYDQPEILNSSLVGSVVSSGILTSYQDTSNIKGRLLRWLQYQRRFKTDFFAGVRKWQEAGIPIMGGTDSGNPGIFQGYSIHRELIHLGDAGLSNWEALASVTSIPGQFLGKKYGLAVGAEANLLLLKKSPLENLAHTQEIEVVIHHGEVVDRDGLINKKAIALEDVPVRTQPLIDDFDGTYEWSVQSDSIQGGASRTHFLQKEGKGLVNLILESNGKVPFSWTYITRSLSDEAEYQDVSAFEGIRLRYRLPMGQVNLSLLTPDVTNFDYHARVLKASEEFQELSIPFSEFKQQWSAPVPWTGKQMSGISLGISSPIDMDLELEVDYLSFY